MTPISEMLGIEYSVAARPMGGGAVCGDVYVVAPSDGGLLVAVIDGIGHGLEAIKAASAAAAILENHSREPLIQLIERCHQGLRNTRGVAMTAISIRFADNTLSWLGVGNVAACQIHPEPGAKPRCECALLRGGIVGYQLPPMRMSMKAITPGDWLVLATDGIRPDFCENVNPNTDPEMEAARILARYFKGNDDALILTARYTGGDS